MSLRIFVVVLSFSQEKEEEVQTRARAIHFSFIEYIVIYCFPTKMCIIRCVRDSALCSF